MRIARPKKPDVPFGRKRSPPPQATKLLTYSLASGIVLMVVLGIVFLPRMFPSQPPVAILVLQLGETNVTNGMRFDVVSVGARLALSDFKATAYRDNVTAGTLDPGLRGESSLGGVTLRFSDANGDSLLDEGDYFFLVAPPPGCYRLEVVQIDVNRIVGFAVWGGCA